jgi:hypothetical protein
MKKMKSKNKKTTVTVTFDRGDAYEVSFTVDKNCWVSKSRVNQLRKNENIARERYNKVTAINKRHSTFFGSIYNSFRGYTFSREAQVLCATELENASNDLRAATIVYWYNHPTKIKTSSLDAFGELIFEKV